MMIITTHRELALAVHTYGGDDGGTRVLAARQKAANEITRLPPVECAAAARGEKIDCGVLAMDNGTKCIILTSILFLFKLIFHLLSSLRLFSCSLLVSISISISFSVCCRLSCWHTLGPCRE